jgi:PAS domain S-box-containing protein
MANRRFLETMQLAAADVIGRPALEVFPYLRDMGLGEAVARVRRTGEPYAATEVKFAADSAGVAEDRWWSFTLVPLTDERGRCDRVVSFAYEVTELVRARQRAEATAAELRRSMVERAEALAREARARWEADTHEAHLQQLFSRAPAPICILRGPRLVVELANAPCCEVWRRRHEEVIGRPLFEALPELESQVFKGLLEDVLATGEPCVGKEVPALLGGDTVFFNFVYSPVRDIDGAVDGIFVIATDVTEQVEAREEMARTIAYNERFTAILGHDLRNPLNAIMATAQHMQRRAARDDISLPAVRILKSGQRMLRMINQLLDLARVRVTGGMHLQPRQLDLADLCRQVLDELRAAHPGSSLELVTAGDLVGRWDGDRLAQVLSNLSANALEHGHPATPVYVRLDGRDPAHVDIRVENQGTIPERVLPILFDPLRSTHYRSAKPGGLGLGLYISQEIVAAHRGRIRVRSTPADGTCFQIELPKLAAAAP